MGREQLELPGFGPEETKGQLPQRPPLYLVEPAGVERFDFRQDYLQPITPERKWEMRRLRLDFEEETGWELGEVMSQQQAGVLELYTTPEPTEHGVEWPSQQMVMEQLTGDGRTEGFKLTLLHGLWRMEHALETLSMAQEQEVSVEPIERLLPDDTFLYRQAMRMGLRTVEQVAVLTDEELVGWCGARPMFENLKAQMQRFVPGWDRELVFPQEVPPEEAFRR